MSVVTGGANPSVAFQQTPTTGFFTNTTFPIPLTLKTQLANGTVADKIDLVVASIYAFTVSTPQTINFATLTDVFGASITPARCKLLALKIDTVVDAALMTVTPTASVGWTSLVPTSGGFVIRAATAGNPDGGYVVFSAPNTSGYPIGVSNKSLDFTPSAHAFNLYVVGGFCSV